MEERKDNSREKTGRVYTVRLEGMTFHAYHGVLPEERQKGNVFVADLEYDCCSRCAESDDVSMTVDYGEAYRIVASEMEKPRRLLETLAADICSRILNTFSRTSRVKVTVKKKNPPVGGPCEWSAASTEMSRHA